MISSGLEADSCKCPKQLGSLYSPQNVVWLWSVNTWKWHYKTPSLNSGWAVKEKESTCVNSRTIKHSHSFVSGYWTVWRTLVSRYHKGIVICFLPLRGLSLEKDLSTSHQRGLEITVWTPLAVPHMPERNHSDPCLWCSHLPGSSGAAIHSFLDCSWLPECLENYSKLN